MNTLTKICNKCKIEKSLSEFYKRTDVLGYKGYRHICIECQKKEDETFKVKPKIISHKKCPTCFIDKDINQYWTQQNRADGHRSQCIECITLKKNNPKEYQKLLDMKKESEYIQEEINHKREVQHRNRHTAYIKNPKKALADARLRQTRLIQRTPTWADIKAIQQFYINCPEGYEVDHIIPLKAKLASGLHVLNNLQYLEISPNRSKLNKFDPIKFNNLK